MNLPVHPFLGFLTSWGNVSFSKGILLHPANEVSRSNQSASQSVSHFLSPDTHISSISYGMWSVPVTSVHSHWQQHCADLVTCCDVPPDCQGAAISLNLLQTVPAVGRLSGSLISPIGGGSDVRSATHSNVRTLHEKFYPSWIHSYPRKRNAYSNSYVVLQLIYPTKYTFLCDVTPSAVCIMHYLNMFPFEPSWRARNLRDCTWGYSHTRDSYIRVSLRTQYTGIACRFAEYIISWR